jgi:hypothetical protein
MPIRTDPTRRGPSPALVPRSRAVPGPPVRHTAAQRGAAGQAVARPAPRRADPTATRLAVAAGGIATVSALIAAIAGGAIPPPTAAATLLAGAAASDPTQATVRYGLRGSLPRLEVPLDLRAPLRSTQGAGVDAGRPRGGWNV